MWVLKLSKTCVVVCGLVLCLLLQITYRYTKVFDISFEKIVSEVTTLESTCSECPTLSLVCNQGRLGNQMCTYATLYGLSALNRRRPTPLLCNTKNLKDIFVGPSISPTTDLSSYAKKNPWTINPYMKPEDAAIPLNSNFLDGYIYPCSYTFFDHVRGGLRKEFRFHDRFIQYAQTVLRKANFHQFPNVTYVGVHIRRGDYKKRWLDSFEGVPVNKEYFRQAFQYFRKKYNNIIFIGVSEDRNWIEKRLSQEFGVYVPENAPSPAHDMAILANCNHTILTYGTFGFWGAYIAGGEVVYFDKFLNPNTSFAQENFVFEKMYPPYWKGLVTVNTSAWFQNANSSNGRHKTDEWDIW